MARPKLPEVAEAGRTSFRRKNSDGSDQKQRKEGCEGRRVAGGRDLWRAGQASTRQLVVLVAAGTGLRVTERKTFGESPLFGGGRNRMRSARKPEGSIAAQGCGERTENRFGGRPGADRDPKAATVFPMLSERHCDVRAGPSGPFLEVVAGLGPLSNYTRPQRVRRRRAVDPRSAVGRMTARRRETGIGRQRSAFGRVVSVQRHEGQAGREVPLAA